MEQKKKGGRAREQLSDLGSFSPRNLPSSIRGREGRGIGYEPEGTKSPSCTSRNDQEFELHSLLLHEGHKL